MWNFFKIIDYYLFQLINFEWSNPLFDFVMPMLRNKYFWSPFYVFLILFFIMNFKKKGIYLIIMLILTVFIADQLSSSIIKPLVHRSRPCMDLYLVDHINRLVGCSASFSFPSSHATNHFAIAFFLIHLFYSRFKWVAPLLIFWAFSISFAQVYVGLHFPSDITVGAILGSLIGYYVAGFSKRWLNLDTIHMEKGET